MNPDISKYSKNIIESIDEGVMVIDRKGDLVFMNPAAEEITFRSAKSSTGKQFRALFSREQLLLEIVSKSDDTGMSFSDHENLFIIANGTPRAVSAATSPLFLENGVREGTILILKDLTHIRDLENAARHKDRLSMLGTLALGLAHEIRNPLGGIKGAAQLMEMELPKESEFRENLKLIVRESDRVNRIVEELLQLGGNKKPAMSFVDIHRVISDIIELQKSMLLKLKIQVIRKLDPSIPPILADKNQMTQLFLNLIKNAVEASQKGGKVFISTNVLSDYKMTQSKDKISRMLVIEIADNGRGISPEIRENLFTPFCTDKSGGTGLGLSVCHKIVADHRGLIKVGDSPEGGALFTVMLPLITEKQGRA